MAEPEHHNESLAFFVVCNATYFVALVALVNSLREVGHREPVYVTDCGLRPEQRALLDGHVTLLDAPGDLPPVLLKLHGPTLIDDVQTAVILDADVIVCASLRDLPRDRSVFFQNDVAEREHPDWTALGYEQRHEHPYVNGGHMILERALIPEVAEAVERMIALTETDRGVSADPAAPWYFLEQDAVNALLGSIDPSRYAIVDEVSYWPFRSRVESPRLLHHIQSKPWLKPRPGTVYSRELARLLEHGAIRLPRTAIPWRLRRGRLGATARAWFSFRFHLSRRTRGRLGLRRKIELFAGRGVLAQ